MKYVKAQNVLPETILRIIQDYVDGEFIYIPRKDTEQKHWGEKSGSKDWFAQRNSEIYLEHKAGVNVEELAVKYYLSKQSIRRIVSRKTD